MPRRTTNNLRWKADLLKLGETTDPVTDRTVMSYPFEREIKYKNLGVTVTDKFTTKDANEVVKKIETRIDRSVENNQKEYRIRIGERIYNIERIYVKESLRVMEVSLSYAN